MQPVTKEGLRTLISEGKAAGKDVSGLVAELKGGIKKPRGPEILRIGKDTVIFSTGPARKEDFEGLK